MVLDRHDEADLLAAAITLVASVSARNAAHGTTWSVTVPRMHMRSLEEVLERVAPLRVVEQREAREVGSHGLEQLGG